MNISLIGSHGVGKTSVFNELLMAMPQWRYLSESTRKLMPILGYEDPYVFVDTFGISFFESIIISHWSILDYKFIESPITIIDRCPLDNLAYYYLLRKEEEYKYEQLLTKLTLYYLKYIDVFILFPIGVFELLPDKMQRKETQVELDRLIKWLLKKNNIEYYNLQSTGVENRCEEIISLIKNRGNYG